MIDHRGDPLYRQGFDDAIDGFPLDRDEAPAYVEGWLAATECKALIDHGTPIGTIRAEYNEWLRSP